ncbi:hypothetical protein CO610_07465 [Lysobacteraceae bacterium NML95-0200]|nr:hypothetical protein CO610_07465 [Xanthomonadaceae bacterium NML95-0200]
MSNEESPVPKKVEQPPVEQMEAKMPPINVQMDLHELRIAEYEEKWSGPLPSPRVLAQFNDIVPGAAERILKMAEEEGRHARDMEAETLQKVWRGQLLGQVFALVVALAGMGASTVLALKGHDGVAAILAGTTVTVVVGAFLKRRQARKKKEESASGD